MDLLRVWLAVVLVVLVPMVIAFWLTIHAGSKLWKRRPIALAYSVAGLAMLGVGVATYLSRNVLIGPDLGTSWPLFLAGLTIYAASLALARPVRRYLDKRTFAGVPQVSGEARTLLVEGPYAAVRHPRYLMVLVGMLGWAMMAHHATAYGVTALCVVGLFAVAVLEERELRQRFGSAYDEYRNEVPMLIPRTERVARLWL